MSNTNPFILPGLIFLAIVSLEASEWPPREWTAFGPSTQEHMVHRGIPDADLLVDPAELKTIPAALVVGDKTFCSRQVALENGFIDLGALFGGVERGKTVYLLAPVVVEEDSLMRLGATADWFMQWYVNGRPLYDTLQTGNGSADFEIDDHIFEVPLTSGENVLAVAVISGSSSFQLGVGDVAEGGSTLQAAMREGRSFYDSSDWLRLNPPIDFPAARKHFEKALPAARTDPERAQVLLAIGENLLADPLEQRVSSIREVFTGILELEELGIDAGRIRAEALQGVAETWLREEDYERARSLITEAVEASDNQQDLEDAQLLLARTWLQQREVAKAERELDKLIAMRPGRPELLWEARALKSALELAAALRSDHPRLFFNADSWPAIRERALTVRKEHLDMLHVRLQGLDAERLRAMPPGAEPMQRVMEAAFVWRVTGEESMLNKARELLIASAPVLFEGTDASGNRLFNRGYPYLAWIAALDWCWNDLPPEEREHLARQLLNAAEKLCTEERIRNRLHLTQGHTLSYYLKTMLYYAGLVLLSSDLEWSDYDNARVLAVLGHGHAIQFTELQNALERAGEDGAFRPDVNYYFGETLNPFWPLLYSIQSAFNQPVPPEWANFLSPDFVLRNIVGFGERPRGRGLGMLYFGQGHSWRDPGGMRSDLMYDHLEQYIHFFADSHSGYAAVAQFMRDRLRAAGGSGSGVYSIYPFLRDDPAPGRAHLPDGMPVARHFGNRVGDVLMSSGFGDDDTYILYRAGSGEDSIDFDTTHFTIYRRGYLALDSGTRAQTRHPDMPEGPCANLNYARQTVAHNAVLIHMPEESFPGLDSNTGGQRYGPAEAELLAFHSVPEYVYVATDATGTYHKDKCAQMVRQFLFLPPEHVVIFDRVTSTKAEFPKSWLLHTSNKPVLNGNEFYADQGEGRIFCRTLLPADARLEPIGGPGQEFWADGRNWPVDPESPWAPLDYDPDNPPEEWGRWRVEVSPGNERTEDFFLHLIRATDQTVEEMEPSGLEETERSVTLSFTSEGRSYQLTFAKRGETGGHIRIIDGDHTLVDQPLENEIMPQSGLALQLEP